MQLLKSMMKVSLKSCFAIFGILNLLAFLFLLGSDEDEDEAAAQSVVNEIDQFLDTLRSKNVLNNIQHQLLHRLLNERRYDQWQKEKLFMSI